MKNIPSHDEIVSFVQELTNLTCYRIVDESRPSRVVLLKA